MDNLSKFGVGIIGTAVLTAIIALSINPGASTVAENSNGRTGVVASPTRTPTARAIVPAAPAPAEPTAAPASPAGQPSVEPVMANKGVPVRDGKFEFVVTSVERPGNKIGKAYLETTAQGEFVIIRMDVTNIGDSGYTLSSFGQRLFNDKGQEFKPSSAVFSLEGASKLFSENINPGNKVTGAPLLFDVPPGTVLSSIELHDAFHSGGVKVNLTGS